jgi:hypothetical protein
MTAPKNIIFYHYSFAIPAEVWLMPEKSPLRILLRQTKALDLPKEILFTVVEQRYLHFPDFFHPHMDTLRSIVDAIRNLGVSIFLRPTFRAKGNG